MQLKNVKIRSGIAWLEPDTIVYKGFSNKEREVNQKLDFARGLRARMGYELSCWTISNHNLTEQT